MHFLTDTKEIYSEIFSAMMENGILQKDDPDMLAFAFTAPITVLIHLCDREPEKEEEVINGIRDFIRHFMQTYGID